MKYTLVISNLGTEMKFHILEVAETFQSFLGGVIITGEQE